jgi:hypothetical protein
MSLQRKHPTSLRLHVIFFCFTLQLSTFCRLTLNVLRYQLKCFSIYDSFASQIKKSTKVLLSLNDSLIAALLSTIGTCAKFLAKLDALMKAKVKLL